MTRKRIFFILRLLPKLFWWCGVVVTLAVIAVFLSAHFRGDVPRIFGYSVLHIVSDSMEPTIEKDSYILVKKTAPDAVLKDDIICFYSTDPRIYGYPNTHRVIEEPTVVDGEYRYVTRGDKSPTQDSYPAEGDRLIGSFVCELSVFSAIMHLVERYMIIIFAGLFFFSAVTMFIPLLLKKGDRDETYNNE